MSLDLLPFLPPCLADLQGRVQSLEKRLGEAELSHRAEIDQLKAKLEEGTSVRL